MTIRDLRLSLRAPRGRGNLIVVLLVRCSDSGAGFRDDVESEDA